MGRRADSGLVVTLSGDLGAGKTQIAKGFARGLGVTERVHSPTFTLVNVYSSGRLICFHLDLYRLETSEQMASAGIEDYLKPKGVTLIEWAERLWPGGQPSAPLSCNHCLRVKMYEISETCRRIEYEYLGA